MKLVQYVTGSSVNSTRLLAWNVLFNIAVIVNIVPTRITPCKSYTTIYHVPVQYSTVYIIFLNRLFRLYRLVIIYTGSVIKAHVLILNIPGGLFCINLVLRPYRYLSDLQHAYNKYIAIYVVYRSSTYSTSSNSIPEETTSYTVYTVENRSDHAVKLNYTLLLHIL